MKRQIEIAIGLIIGLTLLFGALATTIFYLADDEAIVPRDGQCFQATEEAIVEAGYTVEFSRSLGIYVQIHHQDDNYYYLYRFSKAVPATKMLAYKKDFSSTFEIIPCPLRITKPDEGKLL